MRGGFGRRSGSAVQNVEGRLRHRFIGIGEEEADLPHFGVAELGFEGGHSREADAVQDLPVGFTDRVVADADHIRFVVMRLEELRSVGVHVRAKGRRMAVQAVTHGAAVDIDAGACGEICSVWLHVGADHFALYPAI